MGEPQKQQKSKRRQKTTMPGMCPNLKHYILSLDQLPHQQATPTGISICPAI